MAIPVVDERVKYVGATALRGLNARALRDLTDLLVVQVDEKPVAVIIPIAIYMEIQEALWPSSLIPSLESFFREAIVQGLGTDMTPRGGKFARVDPNAELVVDDIDETTAIHDPTVYLNPPSEKCGGEVPSREHLLEMIQHKDPTTQMTEPMPVPITMQETICTHCGKPNPTPLCGACFLAGHRQPCSMCEVAM